MAIGFPALPDLVLGPLAGRPDAAWYQAPPGKWNAAQIVEHLAIGLDASSRTLEERRARDPMRRRPRTVLERLAWISIMRLRWFPPFVAAPEGTRPPAHVEHAAAAAKFRSGWERFTALERLLLPARRFDLFAKHPRLGDLTLEEWMRFHVIHARHHARQIRDRVGK